MAIDWNKLSMQNTGNTVAGMVGGGLNPDMVTTAMLGGYRPNAFGSPLQQAQQLQQFMALQKNIMDAQMGGAGGNYARQFPGNPMAGMPANYQAFYNAMAPMYTDPVWSPSMPGGGPAAGNISGYQFGPVSSRMAPGMAGLVQQMQNAMQSGPSASQMPSLTNSQAGAALPGAGGGTSNASGGGVQTTTTGLSPAQAKVLQMLGQNAVSSGQNPSDVADNALLQILNNMSGGGSQSQSDNSGGNQGGINPLALALKSLGMS